MSTITTLTQINLDSENPWGSTDVSMPNELAAMILGGEYLLISKADHAKIKAMLTDAQCASLSDVTITELCCD